MIESRATESSLAVSFEPFASEPFASETERLLQAVNERDIDTLLGLEDDDFGVVDVDPSGSSALARVQPEWEPRFRRLFVLLDALEATTDSEIIAYRALQTSELGYSVVEFRQHVVGAGLIAVFDCIATIVWRITDDGWKEARWHCSVLDRQVVAPGSTTAGDGTGDGDDAHWRAVAASATSIA